MAERRPWAGAIQSRDDVRRVLADVNRAGLTRANTTALAVAVRPAEHTDLTQDASKLLPAPPELTPVLPWPGLRRGATIAVTGSTSTLMRTLAAGMADGGWAAVVGMPQFGVLAAADHGVPLDRLALVPQPSPDWPTVVAALIDGIDLVVVAAPAGVADGTVRSLQARARQRGAVLLPVTVWPGADVVIEATSRRWEGVGRGHGRLRRQVLELRSTGRGKAARPQTTTVTFGQLPELRIPAPTPGLYDTQPTGSESPPRHQPERHEPPADAWADLQQAAPVQNTLGTRNHPGDQHATTAHQSHRRLPSKP